MAPSVETDEAQPKIDTKGIPSFPSPVTTLNTYLPQERRGESIRHDEFVSAVTKEFEKVYGEEGKKMQTHQVTEERVEAKVWEGVREMTSWEWQYGQTNEVEGNLPVGKVVSGLSAIVDMLSRSGQSVTTAARHCLLTSLTFRLTPSVQANHGDTRVTQDFLDSLALALISKRYETLDGAESSLEPRFNDQRWLHLGTEVLTWLRAVM